MATSRAAGQVADAEPGFSEPRVFADQFQRNDANAVSVFCCSVAAFLCEGCVERLSIRVAPGGTCRISFSPATSPEQTGATKFVDISVEAEAPRATIHHVSGPRLSIGTHAVPARISPACFVFNGRRFCE
jgi:hypothetical protein